MCVTAWTTLEEEHVIVNPIDIPGVDRVIVRGSYDCEPLSMVVQKLKYHYWTGVGVALQDMLRPMIDEVQCPKQTVIVPVPLHSRRLRERGFNQSMYLAQALSKITKFPVSNILQRTRYTTPQAQLSAKERTKNIIGAFGNGKKVLWPKSVILVDDVITTGSTIAECAAILRKNGVRKITAVALAKG